MSEPRPVDEGAVAAVAEVLAAHLDGPCDDPRCHMLGRRNVGPLSEHLAEALADLLAAAWDEGYARGVRDEAGDLERADNPHRRA